MSPPVGSSNFAYDHSDGTHLRILDDAATLRRLIEFHVRARNESTPRADSNGQPLDEMYFGNGDAAVIELAAAKGRSSPRCVIAEHRPMG